TTTAAVPAIAPGQVTTGSGSSSSPSSSGSSSQPYQYAMDYSGSDQAGGQTMGAESLQLEVDVLSAEAVDRIAHGIAQRVAKKAVEAKIHGISVISPQGLAALRLHSVLEAQVKSLEAMAQALAPQPLPDSVETSDAAFTDLPLKVADMAQRVAKGAASALSVFASTVAYAGKKDSARQIVLDAALAKHLSAQKLKVDLPERALPTTGPGLFTRMLDLRARCGDLQRQGADLAALAPIAGAVDNLLKLVFGPAEGPPPGTSLAQQMTLADSIASGLVAGSAVLVVEIAFSGGSYKTRKWIFNTLFGRDGLSYSGGAGVTYFLYRGDDRSTLDSDTLYFMSPHGRFQHSAGRQFDPTNLNG
ncbi:MAG TPA: hypothetical protein VF067_08115, partial [Sphingomicrobium sp.]